MQIYYCTLLTLAQAMVVLSAGLGVTHEDGVFARDTQPICDDGKEAGCKQIVFSTMKDCVDSCYGVGDSIVNRH